MNSPLDREAVVVASNPLGIEGIEFIEYTTPRPQALGQVLESIGFRPVARHRSREVMLYRQGTMNIVVNAHGVSPAADGETPQIAAIALRVRDAGAAQARVVEQGGWPVPVKVQPMELHIPGVHGAGSSRLYFIDRWREFSIYDVDFIPVLVVQYVGADRSADWCAFYGSLFGFVEVPADKRFGILPRGSVLASPCGTFYLQLIEPDSLVVDDTGERLQRLAFGAPDVPAAVKALRARGIDFVETDTLHTEVRGALTRPQLGGVMFELVHHEAKT
jgi:4-hydroxyphenylpyruvate dioxygenase